MILDPAIRDWVLVPIMIVMILVGVLRTYINKLITKKPQVKVIKEFREKQAIAKSIQLRNTCGHLTLERFQIRQKYLLEAFENETYLSSKKSEGGPTGSPADMLTNPAMLEQMTEGVLKNVTNFIPQTIIMGWINYFFTGFIIVKLPFPLTLRFKSMLQRGIETSDMDVTWVSSLSWYFLNLFGLRAVFNIILGEDNAIDGLKDMQNMGGMGAMNMFPGQANDLSKVFKGEKENLELTHHEYKLEGIEQRILDYYKD